MTPCSKGGVGRVLLCGGTRLSLFRFWPFDAVGGKNEDLAFDFWQKHRAGCDPKIKPEGERIKLGLWACGQVVDHFAVFLSKC